MKRHSLLITGLAILLAACKPNISPKAPTAGNADFSRFMVVGDSYAAGFSDGSLYKSAQEHSLAVMLADQFKLVAPNSTFKQPLVPGESGLPHPKNVLAMVTDCLGITSLMPTPDTKWDTAGNHDNITAQEPFNNMSTPGLRIADFYTADYITLLNALKPGELPYAARFYHDYHYSPLQQMLYTRDNIKPTFFTFWLGFYDVFLYAQSGGTGSPNPPGGAPGLTDITPADTFAARYDAIVGNMVANGAKGVLINIPDILDMPYFTTVPVKDGAGNYFQMNDKTTVRKMTDDDMLLLEMPIDSLKCYGYGTGTPIPDKWSLSSTGGAQSEIGYIRSTLTQYNIAIAKTAAKYGLALVDINSYLKTMETGVIFNGVTYTPQFVQGGAFSLDGLHFTQRGYALIANQVINVINKQYGSTLPQIDVNKYPGIYFP